MMPVSFHYGGVDVLYNLKSVLHKSGADVRSERSLDNNTYDATFSGR